ncbi:hypothetical protein ES708_25895 [subsurface metagenome]
MVSPTFFSGSQRFIPTTLATVILINGCVIYMIKRGNTMKTTTVTIRQSKHLPLPMGSWHTRLVTYGVIPLSTSSPVVSFQKLPTLTCCISQKTTLYRKAMWINIHLPRMYQYKLSFHLLRNISSKSSKPENPMGSQKMRRQNLRRVLFRTGFTNSDGS